MRHRIVSVPHRKLPMYNDKSSERRLLDMQVVMNIDKSESALALHDFAGAMLLT